MLEPSTQLTEGIGFLRAPMDRVVCFMSDWLVPQGQHPAERFRADVESALARMRPFWGTSAILVVATQNEWTGVFCGEKSGVEIEKYVAYPSREIPCEGVRFLYRRHSYNPATQEGRLGVVQWQMYEPRETYFLNYGRAVSLARDVDRWIFETSYKPLPFEHLDRYKARNPRDRFTFEMMMEYAEALGIRPFSPDFYREECAIFGPPLWETQGQTQREG